MCVCVFETSDTFSLRRESGGCFIGGRRAFYIIVSASWYLQPVRSISLSLPLSFYLSLSLSFPLSFPHPRLWKLALLPFPPCLADACWYFLPLYFTAPITRNSRSREGEKREGGGWYGGVSKGWGGGGDLGKGLRLLPQGVM